MTKHIHLTDEQVIAMGEELASIVRKRLTFSVAKQVRLLVSKYPIISVGIALSRNKGTRLIREGNSWYIVKKVN